jgi:hypothetical protein
VAILKGGMQFDYSDGAGNVVTRNAGVEAIKALEFLDRGGGLGHDVHRMIRRVLGGGFFNTADCPTCKGAILKLGQTCACGRVGETDWDAMTKPPRVLVPMHARSNHDGDGPCTACAPPSDRWSGDNWTWCGGCQVRGACLIVSCTNHKDAPR